MNSKEDNGKMSETPCVQRNSSDIEQLNTQQKNGCSEKTFKVYKKPKNKKTCQPRILCLKHSYI